MPNSENATHEFVVCSGSHMRGPSARCPPGLGPSFPFVAGKRSTRDQGLRGGYHQSGTYIEIYAATRS